MGAMIEKIWIRKTKWNLRAKSSDHRFGPDPLISIPASGFSKRRAQKA
jgi:hypothetical protein